MLQATLPKVTRKHSPQNPRFPGICEFARSQGVDRVHAFRVPTGQRESRRLTAAWAAYQSAQEKESA